jgi:WD40 repeat protein
LEWGWEWESETKAGTGGWVTTPPGINGISSNGKWLGILPPRSPALYVYRLPGLERVAKLNHLTNIYHFAFAPTGDEVALYSKRGVSLWNTATWQRTRLLTNFAEPFLYSPDGKSTWLGQTPDLAGLYDARTLEARLLLPAGLLPLAVSPDGHYLAVSVDAQRLQLWDLETVRSQLRVLGLDWSEERVTGTDMADSKEGR